MLVHLSTCVLLYYSQHTTDILRRWIGFSHCKFVHLPGCNFRSRSYSCYLTQLLQIYWKKWLVSNWSGMGQAENFSKVVQSYLQNVTMWLKQCGKTLTIVMQFSTNTERAAPMCLSLYFIIQGNFALCDYLHNFALTHLENLHNFSNLHGNFQFNTHNMQ